MSSLEIKKTRQPARHREILYFLGLLLFSILATWLGHRNRERFNWRSEIWSDKAGYYIYLPATFLYQFDIAKAPPGIDQKTGNGFYINHDLKKIFTRFSYGEGLLLSPFFLMTHAWHRLSGTDEEGGFSLPYHRIFNYAAVFYLLTGLWFLKKFLNNYFSSRISYFVIFITFLGTNLMYYTLEDTLMPHIYSFSAAAVFLYLVKSFILEPSKYRTFILMAVVFAIMLVIRPANGLFIFIFLFLDTSSLKELGRRIRILLQPRYIIPLILFIFLFAVPQMLYWKYLYNHYLVSFNDNAGFGNWTNLRFSEVWFSPLNGLFAWSPVVLFFVAGIVVMIWKKISGGIFLLVFFLVISCIAASWKAGDWGCGYGNRAFTEYYTLLCLPFGFLAVHIFSIRNLYTRSLFIVLILMMSFLNFRMTFSIISGTNQKCFFGSTWDWNEYARVLKKAAIYTPMSDAWSYSNDFENGALKGNGLYSGQLSRSGNYSLKVTPDKEFNGQFSKTLSEFGERIPEKVHIRFWFYSPFTVQSKAILVCSIEKDDKSILWQDELVDRHHPAPRAWTMIEKTFLIPEGINPDNKISIYIWNPRGRVFFIDDMKVRFE